jgi:hypothetical protein
VGGLVHTSLYDSFPPPHFSYQQHLRLSIHPNDIWTELILYAAIHAISRCSTSGDSPTDNSSRHRIPLSANRSSALSAHSPPRAKSPPSLLSPRCQRLRTPLPDNRMIPLSMRRTYLVPAPTPVVYLTKIQSDASLSLTAFVSCTSHNYCGYLCARATATYPTGR